MKKRYNINLQFCSQFSNDLELKWKRTWKTKQYVYNFNISNIIVKINCEENSELKLQNKPQKWKRGKNLIVIVFTNIICVITAIKSQNIYIFCEHFIFPKIP